MKINIIKNALLSSFSVVEELIEEIEFILEDRERIFLKYRKSIEEKVIKMKIFEMKKVLLDLKEKLNIKEEEVVDKAVINSRCAKIWEILNDLRIEKLRRYGEINQDIKLIIEPSIKKLLKLTNEIVDLTTKKR
ncbi:MAG: hypothetical protein N2589_05475 [bacterium]|nr:hypothetical protein [bacterium]